MQDGATLRRVAAAQHGVQGVARCRRGRRAMTSDPDNLRAAAIPSADASAGSARPSPSWRWARCSVAGRAPAQLRRRAPRPRARDRPRGERPARTCGRPERRPMRGFAGAQRRAFIDEMAATHGFDRAALTRTFAQARYQRRSSPRWSGRCSRRRSGTSTRRRSFAPARVDGGVAYWNAHDGASSRAPSASSACRRDRRRDRRRRDVLRQEHGPVPRARRARDARLRLPARAPRSSAASWSSSCCSRASSACRRRAQGLFAGALGVPQFMPGSYRSYAVDFDGDGRADLWGAPPTSSAASPIPGAARLAARTAGAAPARSLGRRTRDEVLRRLDGGLSRAPGARRVGRRRRHGCATCRRGSPPIRSACCCSKRRRRDASYWIACNNFYVLTRYNRSRLYAAAVWELAKAIRRLKARAPRRTAPPRRADRRRRAARGDRFAVPARVRDEPPGRRVGTSGRKRRAVGERGDERRRERLAEFAAEVVEGVDPVQHGLDEGAVLVERQQLAEPIGVELGHQDRRRCAVAGAHARGDRGVELGTGEPCESSARIASALRPTSSACACANAFATSSACWLVERIRGAHGHDELDRRFARALVQPLEEGVLGVGAGLAPERRRPSRPASGRRRAPRACRCSRARAAADRPEGGTASARRARRRARRDRGARAFHQPTSPSSTGRLRSSGVCGSARRGSPRRRAAPRSVPSRASARSAARRGPQREALADPVRQRQDVRGRDAEGRAAAALPVTAMKCGVHAGAPPQRGGEPCLRGGGVGERLRRREGFRADDEQRGRRIQRLEGAREVRRIDVATNERHPRVYGPRRRERGGPSAVAHEQRPEVGAAGAEVDDRAQRAARRADPQPAADARPARRIRVCAARMSGMMSRPSTRGACRRRLPQRRVQRGQALRLVDLLAREQRVAIQPGSRPPARARRAAAASRRRGAPWRGRRASRPRRRKAAKKRSRGRAANSCARAALPASWRSVVGEVPAMRPGVISECRSGPPCRGRLAARSAWGGFDAA